MSRDRCQSPKPCGLHYGFDNVVPAFLGVMRGEDLGKMLVQIADL
jgi:NADPH-dependent curcumin reductase CurA